MITSNTYHGNTHFDDFSDQGNYWNQTPYAYYFDGTDDYIDVGTSAPVSDYPFTYAFWIHPTVLDGGYLGGGLGNMSVGDSQGVDYYGEEIKNPFIGFCCKT